MTWDTQNDSAIQSRSAKTFSEDFDALNMQKE